MTRDEEAQLKAAVMKIKGLRGRDIPEATYDKIRDVADGITMPLWGRPATPYQMQHLYDTGAHDPASIHQAFDNLDHPHAPGLKVGEYAQYGKALSTYKQHQ
jgi:hypothetical protein